MKRKLEEKKRQDAEAQQQQKVEEELKILQHNTSLMLAKEYSTTN